MEPIPVICDRCRAQASAGEDPFTAIADSLAFEPVKRNRERVNGWSPDRQRAFIAALVLTGSPKQAAEAVERNAAGVDKLKQAADGASFAAACDAAIALHRERERFRLDQALTALARPAPPSPPLGGEGRGEGEVQTDKAADDLGFKILERYALQLAAERSARDEGRIAEADFYLRQLTFTELCMEVAGLVHVLQDARIAEIDLVAVADTPLTRLLADIRRAVWRGAGEPERPDAPEHLMIDHGLCRTAIAEVMGKGAPAPSWVDPEEWRALDPQQQQARFRAQYARDAEAYKAWIETATENWQRRNSSLPPQSGGGRSGLQGSAVPEGTVECTRREGNHAEHGGGA
jgi:hypothetical protein